MLLIGDIHLQAKHADGLLTELAQYIDQHQEEKNIIFVGDYVYHFSYHRKSLLKLFRFFLQLCRQGKNMYVLAGNHDWLSEHFVFAEGQTVLDILLEETRPEHGKLHFITEPIKTTIEGQEILFLPFLLEKKIFETSHKTGALPYLDNESNNPILHKIFLTAQKLQESDNKYEVFSGALNEYLVHHVGKFLSQSSYSSDLLIIHHYYVADTQFPGQKSRFYFKDIALSSDWLKVDGIRLLSGHIHQAFSIANYLCLGSIWSTSPLEYNQSKYLWHYDSSQKLFSAQELHYNPYLRIDATEPDITITRETLSMVLSDSRSASKDCFSSPLWNVSHRETLLEDLSMVTVSLITHSIDYSNLNDIFPKELQQTLLALKISKKQEKIDDLLSQLQTEAMDFSGGRHDRKAILEQYLLKVHPQEIELYKKELQDLGLY